MLSKTQFFFTSIKNISINHQTKLFNSTSTAIRPIINKVELDSIDGEDPRHFNNVKFSDGYESNAMSYNPIIHKFIKQIMHKGEISTARKQVDMAFYKIKLKQLEKMKSKQYRVRYELNPQEICIKALANCKPILKIIQLVKGGISYKVPIPITEKEREFRANKIMSSCANEKNRGRRYYDKLAEELINAHNNKGNAIKKKVDIHKTAEANRAYAHFRWQKS